MSIEKKAEEMDFGSTLEENEAMLPCSEESREELDEEDGAEQFELNKGGSIDVKLVEDNALDGIESMMKKESEILKCLEPVVQRRSQQKFALNVFLV